MSVKQEGKINYHNWWKSLTLGLISLAAGGSIGPEASTTVLGSGMVNWLGDRLRLIAYSSDWKWNHFWDTIVSKKQLKNCQNLVAFLNQNCIKSFLLNYGYDRRGWCSNSL